MDPRIATSQFADHLSPAAAPADLGPGPVVSEKIKVLIVEDDFIVASDLEHNLTEAGFRVVGIAASAEDAIGLAASAQPSVAIMDIRLTSKRDGIETAIELYRDFGIRSVFATAHSDEKTRARAQAAAPLGWISKPYASRSLIDLLQETLSP